MKQESLLKGMMAVCVTVAATRPQSMNFRYLSFSEWSVQDHVALVKDCRYVNGNGRYFCFKDL